MTKRIDVVICEFNRLLGEGIASLLREAGYDPMIIDLECYNFSVLDVKHDRVLFLVGDLAGKIDPDSLSSEIKSSFPNALTVIIANDYSQRKRTEAKNCGVNGILLTSISSDRLLKSLELIAMGEDVFTATGHSHISATSEQNDLGDVPAFTRLLPGVHREEPPTDAEDGPAVDQQASNNAVQSQKDCKLIRREELSQRESEILNYLIEGNSNKIIARKCHITEATVKVHLKSILRKVHAANRTQAAVWAMNRIKESEQARAVESGIARENDEDRYSNDRCGISSWADKRFVPPRPILGTRVEEINCP